MKKKTGSLQAQTSPARRFTKNCAGVCGGAVLLGAVLLCGAAFLLTRTDLPHTLHEPLTTVITAVATLLSTYLGGVSGKGTGLTFGAVSGFAVFLVLFALSMLTGNNEITEQTLVKLLALLSAGGLGAVAGGGRTRNKALKI